MIFIEIPFKTPTINHLYFSHPKRANLKILTKEARELRKKIEEICEEIPEEDINLLVDEKLKVVVEVYENWYYNSGDVAKKDIMNREKFMIDSIFKAIEIDDKNIFEISFKKCQSDDKEFTHVRIYIENGL